MVLGFFFWQFARALALSFFDAASSTQSEACFSARRALKLPTAVAGTQTFPAACGLMQTNLSPLAAPFV